VTALARGTAPAPPGRDAPTARLGAALDRGWDRLVAANPWLLGCGLAVLVVLRSGVRLNHADTSYILIAADAFPQVQPDWRSAALIGPSLAGVLGIETEGAWFALNAVVILAVLAVAGAALVRRVRGREGLVVAAVWLALASFPVAVLQRVGWYDVYTILGAILVVWGRRRSTAVIGGIVLGLTNAEQGAVGLLTAALVLVALRPDDRTAGEAVRDLRASAAGHALALGVLGVALGRVGAMAVYAAQDVVVQSRADMFGDLLGPSVVNSLSASSAGVFAWLGMAWGLVALTWFVRSWSLGRWCALVGSLVALPALATITTLDGTRVFAMASLPGLLVLVGWVADRVEDPAALGRQVVRRATVAALCVAPFVPALITDPMGNVWFAFPWSS
jgi:hypothetical protein